MAEKGPPPVEIKEEPTSRLELHAEVSIAFSVEHVLAVDDLGLEGLRLIERPVAEPYVKDYDRYAGNHPSHWGDRFDLTNWGLLSAWRGSSRVGGAVIATATLGVEMLRGRDDLAVLWDLRVAQGVRGEGIGGALFDASEQWALARGCSDLEIETQNVNVPACRFYLGRGCELRAIHRFAYPELRDEVKLLWGRPLRGSRSEHP